MTNDRWPGAPPKVTRDIIVFGASAGGVEAATAIISALPRELAASIFLVIHTAAYHASLLPSILSNKGPFPATHAVHGESIVAGHVYIAPPDNHMTLHDGTIRVVRGPRENGHRPAVDPLFRSAARVYGARVIGVVLSGSLDCGSAGLMAIKAAGGTAVVQHPNDALAADMPTNALRHVSVDHVAPLADLAPLLARLVNTPIEAPSGAGQNPYNLPSQPAAVVCPECQGAMVETEQNGLLLFQCHVGHRYTSAAMTAEQADSLESALWASVRALEESATLAERLVASSTASMRERFIERARTMRHYAQTVKTMLMSNQNLSRLDPMLAEQADTSPDNPT